MRTVSFYALLLGLLALGPLVSAQAAPPSNDEKKIREMVKDIGQPARRERVEAWLARSEEKPNESPRLVALALGRCGGSEAVLGLLSLEARFKNRIVRATLMSTVGVGLRWPLLARPAMRTLSYSRDADLRLLAVQVLGRMGDGRHVPALLDAVVSTDERTRIAALFALRLLSGVTLPGRIKRWESWWKHAEVQGRRDLRLALEQMEAGTDSANALLWRGVAQRTAWIDIEHARNAVATWLQGSDIRLHAEAAILVGHLRLADQGDRLEQVARRTRVTATRMMMEEVLTSLGHEARKRSPTLEAPGAK